MPVLKCKMCGGNLQVEEGQTVCECEYCGTRQTIPSVDDEKKLNLYNRANRLRSNNEFDKAYGVFESIVADFPEEAEAYWGLCLCKYGIEYVDDPLTGKKIPTCHRTSYDSIFDDNNFEMALEYADGAARGIYREEAKEIDRLQKAILEIAKNEEPFDIFICYKETDEYGDRTVDSVIAQDVYTALTDKGYKVFFSRITLEDKLGQEYEPYIFAALNSAKVMLAFGTSYDYYNAVWVKNEWSRYLDLMKNDKNKHLIPCFKGIDAYDMPKEFIHLQAQDMGKVGALQDLLRGIEKIIPRKNDRSKTAKENLEIDSLLKKGSRYMEKENYEKAEDCYESVLTIDPTCGDAYFGLFFASFEEDTIHGIMNNYPASWDFNEDGLITKIREFGSKEQNIQIDKLLEWQKAELRKRELLKSERESKAKEEAFSKILIICQDKALFNAGKNVRSILQACNDNLNSSYAEEITKHCQDLISSKRETVLMLNEKLEKLKKEDADIDEKKTKVNDLYKRIKEYESELQKLGIFQGKKKEEIKHLISETELELADFEKNINDYTNSINELEKQLYDANQFICDGDNHIEDNNVQNPNYSNYWGLSEAIDIYEKYGTVDAKVISKRIIQDGEIKFGRYEQKKGLFSVPKGDITWIVLKVENNCLLLISEYLLDCCGYKYTSREKADKPMCWEESSLREFLNNSFYKKAFDEREQSQILETSIITKDYSDASGEKEEITNDKVFVLSVEEIEKYGNNLLNKTAVPTGYAKETYELRKGVQKETWWLRNPCKKVRAAVVNRNGTVVKDGYSALDYSLYVRPAIWIKIGY